ncbi:MAG: transaldolase family protein [Patescibacteria group bacterium]
MKPHNLTTKIFLDSGDPQETSEALRLLGFLDGQTTNPSLVAKNPEIQKYLASGKKLTEQEVYTRYQSIIREISHLIPEGSVSIEVYADKITSAEKMFVQGQEMFGWIPNAHVKYPIIQAGLAAAEMSVKANMRVNMTLCFTEEQAAAVYAATRGAKAGNVFISPFVGRLDDRGENGMTLIKNILKNFKTGDKHVQVLSASVRTINHFLYSLALGADIITAPLKILVAWEKMGKPVPGKEYIYNAGSLKNIPYAGIDLNHPWTEYNYQHVLTDQGIEKFVADWKALIDN